MYPQAVRLRDAPELAGSPLGQLGRRIARSWSALRIIGRIIGRPRKSGSPNAAASAERNGEPFLTRDTLQAALALAGVGSNAASVSDAVPDAGAAAAARIGPEPLSPPVLAPLPAPPRESHHTASAPHDAQLRTAHHHAESVAPLPRSTPASAPHPVIEAAPARSEGLPNGILQFFQTGGAPDRNLHGQLRFLRSLALVLLGMVLTGGAYLASGQSEALESFLPDTPVTVAADKVPETEPLVFASLEPADARTINQEVPFAPDPGPGARPFGLDGDSLSKSKAIDCLATAMWYEAGNTEPGQLSVGQVILNRVRHPAFPKTVCGVVFQGAERRTGCQFTFTCDGSIAARRPSRAEMGLAENRAAALLYGFTFKPVGLATHYHTDWVHPTWSAKMDKIAQVESHLFFRWHGAWGQPAAMRQKYAAAEPTVERLASLSAFHALGAPAASQAPPTAFATAGIGEAMAQSAEFVSTARTDGSAAKSRADLEPAGPLNVDLAAGGGDGTRQAMGAIGKCGSRNFCKLLGRVGADKRLAFLYVRDRKGRVERAYWDCAIYTRDDPRDCLTVEAREWIAYTAQI
ncbi:MAG TPA: cell wall hydrolase [Novosphingobium sp.]|nr:cell wall hydrolase [Novosphingobium sp.]